MTEFGHRSTGMAGRAVYMALPHHMIVLPLVALLTGTQMLTAAAAVVEHSLTFDTSHAIQHLILRQGQLYVGATNRLYQLRTSDLGEVARVVTGPRLDSEFCDSTGSCIQPRRRPKSDDSASATRSNGPNSTRVQTPAVNKLLVVFEERNVLISCASIYQGICELRKLKDISQVIPAPSKDRVPVVANAGNASTVGFLGPSADGKTVLYVGASYTYEYYRDHFPAVATRSLDPQNLFDFAFSDDIFSTKSNLKLMRGYHPVGDKFPINYIGGFTAGGYVYWLSVQRKDHDQPFTTKVGRICQSDKHYASYSEIEIHCLGSLNTVDLVLTDFHITKMGPAYLTDLGLDPRSGHGSDEFLVGSFVRLGRSGDRSDRSAVCVYPLRDIEQMFTANLERCRNAGAEGADQYKMPHFGSGGCGAPSLIQDLRDGCQYRVGSAGLSLTKPPVVTLPDDQLTSILVDIVGESTIVFAGTANGRVAKIQVDSQTNTNNRLYHWVSVAPSSPIGQDMQEDDAYLYIPAGKMIYKIGKENCEQHNDCATCVDSQDPYCGWCSLERKCSLRSACQHRRLAQGFIPSGTDDAQCPRMVEVSPMNVSITEMTQKVTIHMNTLPTKNTSYACVFGSVKIEGQLTGDNRVVCELPRMRDRPTVKEDMDHSIVPLHVWSELSGVSFVSGQFTFYDCSRQKICLKCLKTRWPCNWCLQENRCVSPATSCLEKVATLYHELVNPNPDKVQPSQCPHIVDNTTILVPSGFPIELRVPAMHLDKVLTAKSTLECVLSEHSPSSSSITPSVRVPAQLASGVRGEQAQEVVCAKAEFTYGLKRPKHLGRLSLMVDGRVEIDEVKVHMYKCSILGEDCSRCLALPPEYKCNWCSGACAFRDNCPLGDMEKPSKCPPPMITSVNPSQGPVDGGTSILISGRDLGTSLSTIKVVVGVDCRVTKFDPHTGVTCITGNYGRHGATAVTVIRPDVGPSLATHNFTYVVPHVASFRPSTGPRSGGTLLRISGRHLLAATRINASIGSLPCAVDRNASTSTELVCRTSPAPKTPTRSLTMTGIEVKLDRTVVGLRQEYTYVEDPAVKRIEPKSTFESGGRRLTVYGERFSTVAAPRIYLLSLDGRRLTDAERCSVLNDTTLSCVSPKLKERRPPLRRALAATGGDQTEKAREVEITEPDLSAYERISLGFEMDDVQAVRNLSHIKLTITPDPQYRKFKDGKTQFHEGQPLIIEGKHLNLASSPNEVTVWIGSERCNITFLASEQLVCHPPAKKPRLPRSVKKGNPEVVVEVGNLDFPLGTLVYDPRNAGSPVSLSLVGGIVAGAVALLLICIAVVATWSRRKHSQAERECRWIQLQMDEMESNVRKECKQAFAELQTDISDLTSDLVALGCPYHSRATYASRIMFKDEHMLSLDWQHPTFHNGYPTPEASAVLVQFEQLLWSHNFVLHIVDVLEADPTFSAQDRVHVASLLTAILARNMQYMTDIVMVLLKNLIAKCVEGKHPQLMLRRTESVVEKMLANWIALCLYDYLHLVYIIPPNHTEPDEKMTCRVLSCDTISQVKGKMLDSLYRNAAASQRPAVHDIDIEWRCADGHFILTDDDRNTPPTRDGWRRLNTLEHYSVPPSAVFAILPRNHKSFTLTRISDCSNHTYASIGSSSTLLLSRHSPESGLGSGGSGGSNVEQSVRYYHLVKPEELVRHQQTMSRKGTTTADQSGSGSSPLRAIPEIYLTRLLATKGTLQKFIDDFFHSALTASCSGHPFPPAIKYLFDFLESQALDHGIADPSVVSAWKNNSLLLRFWVNVIKNPEFVFDVDKTVTVDSCLSVVAQTFMDACAQGEVPRLGKDSPSNKLLFARDLPRYRALVQRFYADIRAMPPVTEQELSMSMAAMSNAYAQEFQVTGAVQELLGYVVKYDQKILSALDNDVTARHQRLPDKLENILHQLALERAMLVTA